MGEFWRNIGSPSWWTGVVVVGILINILAAYLKPRLDSFMSRVSNRWAARSQKLRDERAKRIDILRHDKNEQLLAAIRDQKFLLRSLLFFMPGLFMFGLSVFIDVMRGLILPPESYIIRIVATVFGTVVGLIGLLMLIFATLEYNRSANQESELCDSREPPADDSGTETAPERNSEH